MSSLEIANKKIEVIKNLCHNSIKETLQNIQDIKQLNYKSHNLLKDSKLFAKKTLKFKTGFALYILVAYILVFAIVLFIINIVDLHIWKNQISEKIYNQNVNNSNT